MFEQIFKEIKNNDVITIYGHFNPDGDCYGSQVALKESILSLFPNKEVYILGTGLPNFYDMLGKPDIVSDEIIINSLAIVLDSNDQTRCEDQRVNLASKFVKLDHHIDYGTFRNFPYVVLNECNSTSEIVLRMLLEQNMPINKKCANALYLGILTDTARFQFVSDFSSCFKEMALLVDKGAEPKKILRLLNKINEDDLKVKAYILSNYKKTKNNVLYYALSYKEICELNVHPNVVSNYINLLSNVDSCHIWASFCEHEEGFARVEVRSDGPSIFEACRSIGGGGHPCASGATLEKYDSVLIEDFLKKLDAILEK